MTSSIYQDKAANYRFYPCAYVPTRVDAYGLYFRYKTAKEVAEFEHFTSYATPFGAYVDCPDRELYFCRNMHVVDHDRPLRNWDGCLSLSWYYNTAKDYRGDRFMVNHTAFSGTDNRMRKFDPDMIPEIFSDRIVICDSGGFQLRTGNQSFIDPVELAEFYSDYVDEGVTLDIPIVTYERSLVERAVKIQEKNTKRMLEHLPEDFRLANVCHGFNYHDFTWFRQNMWEDESVSEMLCIPSSVVLPELQSLDRLLYHLSHGLQYDQYHLLGVYNTAWLPLAIRATHLVAQQQNRDILLTSDASSSVYSAKTLRWHKQMHPYNSVTRWPLGNVSPMKDFITPHNEAGCRCEVCQVVKYTDVFKILPDTNTAPFLIRHNEQETLRWADQVSHAAATMDEKQYYEFCKMQTGNKGSQSNMKKSFDYLNRFLDEGWEKTHRHYQAQLSSLFMPKTASNILFEDSHDGLLPDEDEGEINARMDLVLKRYEYYYEHGKKADF